jgi:putative membrane protein
MANERTYLAWTRTALAVVTIGIVVREFILEQEPAPAPAALLLIVAGFLLLLYAVVRYYRQQELIESGKFSIDRLGPAMLTIVLTIVVVVGTWVVLG